MAQRPVDLTGKVIGLLDNTKEQADVILRTLGEVLVQRYGAARVVVQKKEHYTKPATDEQIEAMSKEVQIAIAGLGG